MTDPLRAGRTEYNGRMELLASPQAFFQDAVTAAIKAQQLPVSEGAAFYLVNLLCDFTKVRADAEPLSLQLVRAPELSLEQRAQTLREVGDQSLYMSGLFPDHLVRRMMDVEFYMELGGMAYRELAGLSRAASAGLRAVYAELSTQFGCFVALLRDVRSGMSLEPAGDPVGLYEQWRKTGSGRLAERLRACGFILPPRPVRQ